MNNLLRTLSNNAHLGGSPSDLHSLLTGIREIRAQDSKSTEQFYEALEGVLHELRIVTMDNRDAEAFLKPVVRSEYPDYHEIISHPMDLQTMLKKVKAKSYKNKLEFSDDLNLIWDNCFRYNSTPDHPLRACAMRLRAKARVLLESITDRSERIQPHIWSHLPSPPLSGYMPNGKIKSTIPNGKAIIKQRKDGDRSPFPSIKIPPQSISRTPSSHFTGNGTQETQLPLSPQTPSPIPFPERTSIIRTPETMSTFMEMDRQLDELMSYASTSKVTLNDLRQRQMSMPPLSGEHDNSVYKLAHRFSTKLQVISSIENVREREKAINSFRFLSTTEEAPRSQLTQSSLHRLSQDSNLKRKRSESLASSDDQQRKKVRVKAEPSEAPRLWTLSTAETIDPLESALDIWWKAMGTNAMLGGGMPSILQPEKAPILQTNETKEKGIGTGKRKQLFDSPAAKFEIGRMRKKVKRRKSKEQKQSLLSLMNSNISTLRRLRTAHNRYTRLVQDNKETGEPGESQGTNSGGVAQSQASIESSITFDSEATTLVDEPIDRKHARERPWKVKGEVDGREARECIHWMCGKVLEHATFQGTSSLALNSLCDIASAYISNLGNTLHLLMDKFSQRMSPEEIILHALFENGVPSVSDLECYIKDDVIRHGSRLQELEKKTTAALEEVVKADVLDDDAVFGDDADEDNFASGLFGDLLGEDYLGLEASGILSELNLGSMSIPKRLWKGKKTDAAGAAASREKGEPPLPYPLPPPFVPLRSDQIDNQIGLLQDYYRGRFNAIAHPPTGNEKEQRSNSTTLPIPSIAVLPPTNPSSLPVLPLPLASSSLLAPPGGVAQFTSLASNEEPLILSDDAPDPAHTKISPIGQVILPSVTTATGSKKKVTKKDGPAGEQGDSSPSTKSKGGGSKKPMLKKEDGKDQSPGTNAAANGIITPSPKKKKTSTVPSGSAQSGGGTPSPTKKASPNKASKGNVSPSKGPSNTNSNGPVLIPPV